MRYPLFIAYALASLPCLASVDAPVTSVVLYPGGASVTRSAQVAPGAQDIVVALPAGFNPHTLRVQAPSGVTLGGITTHDRTEAVSAGRAELETKILALRDQQALLEAEIRSASLVKEYLERFVRTDLKEDQPRADAKALAGLLDTVGRGASESMLKIQKLGTQVRDIGKMAEELQGELALLPTETRATQLVTVRVAGGKGGAVTLSYQLANAGWKPGYRAGLDAAASTVDLERLATIAQNTGEDWSNVRMTLSTSQPRHSPVGREPQPWLLSWHAQQEVHKGTVYVTGSRIAESAPVELDRASAPAPAMLGDSLMAEIQGAFATEFEVPGRVSLAANGREVQVNLSTQTLAVRQYLRVAPRLERHATVIAEAARPAGVWPAGPIQLFRDGNYIGSTHWNPQESEHARFSFGRDELLTATVNAVEGKSGTRGLFNSRTSREMEDAFTLVNLHKRAVDVVVLESSPVSTSDEVKVHARFDPMPSVEAWEKRRGVVAWKKRLAAGETAQFKAQYQIDFPKEGVLAGMR